MTWKAWGDHPLIVTISVITGLITIFQFVKPNQPSLDIAASTNNSTSNSKAQSTGWIRLGAINHESETLRDGTRLIKTTQPVTVVPSVVPKIGDSVSTTTSIHLRKAAPKFPDYNPDKQEKLSVLREKTELTVLQKVSFVDPKLPSTTIIWAEVGLKD